MKKPWKNEKKHSVLIIFPCHGLNQNSSTSDLSFSQVTSVEKRKSRKHFSASAYGLGLKKLFLGFLFSTSVTWEKLKSDVEKFYFRRDMEKNQNKILFFQKCLKWLLATPFMTFDDNYDNSVTHCCLFLPTVHFLLILFKFCLDIGEKSDFVAVDLTKHTRAHKLFWNITILGL